MDVFVPKLAHSDVLLILPLIHGRSAPLLLLPIPIDEESLMGIGLLPDPYFFMVCIVKLALRVLWVVNTRDAMGMALADQTYHAFFLEATRTVLHQICMP